MKKSKLSITLVTSFIAAMAMSACSSVSSSKNAIVTFTPYGSDEKIALITDDIYGQYGNTSAGVSKFYDKILEELIRYKFKQGAWADGDMKYSEIENWAKNKVQEQKDTAKANAKSNGTNYDDEWDSILESNNVENSTELKEKFIYEKEKEVMKNWFATDTKQADSLRDEFIGIYSKEKDDGTTPENEKPGKPVESGVSAAMPYHIRHILVKVDEAANADEKYYKGTVTDTQAKLLYNIVSTLASGKYTFAQVASMYSEDGSASNGGDVGIMTNAATSGSLGMVNEFQLGLYAYDNIYNAENAASPAAATIKAGLGFDSVVGTKKDGEGHDVDATVADKLPAAAVEVPYEAFLKMNDYADVTADKYGNKLANGSTTVYPRNIIWNKYMNLHNVFLIKNAKCGDGQFGNADKDTVKSEFAADKLCKAGTTAVDNTNGAYSFNDQGYLVDESGNIIICVRSQYGLHFMVIEKSMYDYAETKDVHDKITNSALADYYSTKIPGDDGYVSNSYVGYINSQNKEDYKKRADDVKSKITSFDSTYDFRLYTWLQDTSEDGGKLTLNFTEYAPEGLKDRIDNYIGKQQKSNSDKQKDGLQSVWKSYTRLIGLQEANRNVTPWQMPNPTDGSPSPWLTRLVSEKIADDFFELYKGNGTPALYEAFAEGGNYYFYA